MVVCDSADYICTREVDEVVVLLQFQVLEYQSLFCTGHLKVKILS